MPRLFTAIDLPDQLRERICGLHRRISGLRWTPPGQIHLTLSFIGEAIDDQFALIKEAMLEISRNKFTLKISGTGFFPDIRRPSIFWIGAEDNQVLLDLKNDMDKILLETIGLVPERRAFVPHITIARIKEIDRKSPHLLSSEFAAFSGIEFEVGEFILYSSELTPEGAVHKKEATCTLK